MVRTLAFALTFLVVVGPWSLENILRYGDLNNLNHLNIAFALFDTRSSWLKFDSYAEQFPSLLSLIVAHPGAMLRHLAKNAFHFPEEVLARRRVAGDRLRDRTVSAQPGRVPNQGPPLTAALNGLAAGERAAARWENPGAARERPPLPN